MIRRPPGRIITFYSYKGGTGRSMALANVAWILASNGLRVLMVDWDLEAPGLHRYFTPFLEDKNLASARGILDMVMNFETEAVAPREPADSGPESLSDPDWYVPLAKVEDYVQPLECTFPSGGVLDLLPAGRQDASYSSRANTFDWGRFYDKFGGGVFLEAVKKNMRQAYDYVLIDSRTGVSDVAGVCTVQMPDDVVLCFTLNVQSIEGAAAVAQSARQQRMWSDRGSDSGSLRVFPVPMRVEFAEKERLDSARAFAQRTMTVFLDHMPADRRENYWGSVEVPYVAFYAFEEVLATLADPPGRPSTLLSSLERLTAAITGGIVTRTGELPEGVRDAYRGAYLKDEAKEVKVQTIESVLNRRPEYQRLADQVTTQRRAWIESARDKKYLMNRETMQMLELSDVLAALLQDRSFREFWDASTREANMRSGMVDIVLAVIEILVVAGLLTWIVVFKPFPVAKEFIRGLAGIIGAALARAATYAIGIAAGMPPRRRVPGFARWFPILEDVPMGAVSAYALQLVAETLQREGQLTVIVAMILAGYFARGLFQSVVQTLIVKVEPK